jgi:hypothetical protein
MTGDEVHDINMLNTLSSFYLLLIVRYMFHLNIMRAFIASMTLGNIHIHEHRNKIVD